MRIIEGIYKGEGRKVAIAAARFNELVVARLVEGCRDALLRHGVADADIDLAWAPGAFELPLVAGKLAASGRYGGLVVLGAVIRGSTPHFDYVAAEVSKGVAQEGLRTGLPIIFGVLTCDSMEQALERAGLKAGNKGWDAGMACLEMMDLVGKL